MLARVETVWETVERFALLTSNSFDECVVLHVFTHTQSHRWARSSVG